jgi:deoxyribose-phosphate aldolase
MTELPQTRSQLAAMIDHAILRPEATLADLRAGCEAAARLRVASVCVRPCDVAEAARLLAGESVAIGTVVGFPHGASATAVKVAEVQRALADGAAELDMVLNIGRLRSGEIDLVRDEIAAVVAHAGGRCVKVIFECGYLTAGEIAAACRAAVEAKANFVKTSTGFGPRGASVEDVRLLRQCVGPSMGVKAAGGIDSLEKALAMVRAGATRLGASRTEAILNELSA